MYSKGLTVLPGSLIHPISPIEAEECSFELIITSTNGAKELSFGYNFLWVPESVLESFADLLYFTF